MYFPILNEELFRTPESSKSQGSFQSVWVGKKFQQQNACDTEIVSSVAGWDFCVHQFRPVQLLGGSSHLVSLLTVRL